MFHLEYAGGDDFLVKVRAVEKILQHVPRILDPLRLKSSHAGTKSVQIIEDPNRGRISSHYDKSTDTISLYPSFFSTRPDADVYEAFGQRHWDKNLTQREHVQWINAVVYPKVKTLEMFAQLVRTGAHDAKGLLNNFSEPGDRLIVIHLLNALKANHMSPRQAQWTDLYHYPPTASIMGASVPYSIRPILGTYRPAHDRKGSYAKAFSEYCVNKGRFLCTVDSVGDLYRSLFMTVTFQ